MNHPCFRTFPRVACLVSLAFLVSFLAPAARAGQNAAAVAHMYWQTGNTPGSASRTSTSGTPKLVVTVTGLVSFRGADIQLLVGANDGGPLPDAWQGNGTNGCNDGNLDMRIGGTGGNGAVYPNAFTGVSGLATSQNKEFFGEGSCLTPGPLGLLWLSAAGATGAARNPATEYGLWSITFDVRGTAAGGAADCPGDLGDPAGPRPVTIVANQFTPCAQGPQGAVIAVLDAANQLDFIPLAPGTAALGWEAAPYTGISPSPLVTLIGPNGGKSFVMGTNAIVSTFVVDDAGPARMDVALSTDGGATYPAALATDVPYVDALPVTLPSIVTTTARIRVTVRDADGHAGLAASESNFSIYDNVSPTVTLLAPNGGESISIGSLYNIAFAAGDNFALDKMTLELSTNNGLTFPTVIAQDVPVVSPYAWTVPNMSTSQARIRVTVRDVSGNTASDASNGSFAMLAAPPPPAPPFVGITTPNGGESYLIGQQVSIAFQSSSNVTMTSMKLELSTDGGVTYPTVIASGIPVASPYTWTVPNVHTVAARIRLSITDSNNQVGVDVSDGNFRITGPNPPSVTLLQPNGGQVFTDGQHTNITFQATDNAPLAGMKVELSTDGGFSYPTLVAANAPATSPYDWVVPATATSAARIRLTVTDTDGNSAVDFSDANFQIVLGSTIPPSVTVVSPNGGEVVAAGSHYPISYLAGDNTGIASISIKLSTDGGLTYPTAVATNVPLGSPYDWTVPGVSTRKARIQVLAIDLDGNGALDASNQDFRIKDTVPPTVAVLSPNGGEAFEYGGSMLIQWSISDNHGPVTGRIDFSSDGGVTFPTSLYSGFLDSGSVYCQIPFTNTQTGRIRITAYDPDSNSASDASDADFSIHVPEVVLDVLAPNGGESWQGGSTQQLQFANRGYLPLDHVSAWLSTDGGATYPTFIGTFIHPAQPALWVVPDLSTTTARVRMTGYDAAGDSSSDTSNSDFTITPTPLQFSLTLATPNGGEQLHPGDAYTITWSEAPPRPGRIVNVLLSSDGGLTYAATMIGIPDSSLFHWTVPNSVGTNFKIKVLSVDPSGTVASDESDAPFSIKNPGATGGLNAGAIAHIYWQVGNGTGSPNVRSDSGTPKFVVTVTGLKSFRGAEIQLQVAASDAGFLPAAWQGNGTGGCNDGMMSLDLGGTGGTYPSAFTGIPGLAISQNREFYNAGDCLTQFHRGLFWLSAAGAGGVTRNPATEYALWSIAADLRGTALGGPTECEGDLGDPSGGRGVTILPRFSIPCSVPTRGAVLALLDQNNNIDYVPFLSSKLGWLSDPNTATAVEIAGLEATVSTAGMRLEWRLVDPERIAAVRIERAGADGAGAQALASGLQPRASMSFVDAGAEPGAEYTYAVYARDLEGTESRAAVRVTVPGAALAIQRVEPNPSRGPARIRYSLAKSGVHVVEVLGVDGRRVRTLLAGPGAAGEHAVDWDGRDDSSRPVAGGIYFIRLRQAGQARVERMTLLP